MNQEAVDQIKSERDAVRAACMAYASEFAPDADGCPDTGNIHANIRALKKERDEYQVAADNLAAENKVLQEALNAAGQSLATVAMLAGRKTYGMPPIETFMATHEEVRAYAASRSAVALAALTKEATK